MASAGTGSRRGVLNKCSERSASALRGRKLSEHPQSVPTKRLALFADKASGILAGKPPHRPCFKTKRCRRWSWSVLAEDGCDGAETARSSETTESRSACSSLKACERSRPPVCLESVSLALLLALQTRASLSSAFSRTPSLAHAFARSLLSAQSRSCSSREFCDASLCRMLHAHALRDNLSRTAENSSTFRTHHPSQTDLPRPHCPDPQDLCSV